MTQRPLNDLEAAELAALNARVSAAIAARRQWLDTKMIECSTLQVGDDLYDVNMGQRLGTIVAIYRYWRDRDEGIRDSALACDYEFEIAPGMCDNTSSYGGTREFGTRADAATRADLRAQSLRRSSSSAQTHRR